MLFSFRLFTKKTKFFSEMLRRLPGGFGSGGRVRDPWPEELLSEVSWR